VLNVTIYNHRESSKVTGSMKVSQIP